jgi:hypothetical protein
MTTAGQGLFTLNICLSVIEPVKPNRSGQAFKTARAAEQ